MFHSFKNFNDAIKYLDLSNQDKAELFYKSTNNSIKRLKGSIFIIPMIKGYGF